MNQSLQQLKPGEACKVTSIGTKGLIKRRLMDMGVTPGVEIRLVKIAPLGDPIEINIRGYELSLRKEEANQIYVERI